MPSELLQSKNQTLNTMLCLLCNSSSVEKVDNVPVQELVKSYKKAYQFDIEYLFKESDIQLLECKGCGLRFYTPHVTGDDSFYNVLQKREWYYRDDKEEYHFAASFVKPGDKVLDVGCGKGAFAKFIPQAIFKGLEFSSDAIKTGIQKGYDIIQEPIEKHAVKQSQQYNVVTAFQVLEHISNISQFIKAAAACVKPQGKLIIAVPSEESYIKFLPNAFLNMPPHHITRWTDRALESLARQINFKVVQIHHEKMDLLHRGEYVKSYIERILRLNLASRTPLMNRTSGYRLRKKVADGIGTLVLKRGVSDAWFGMGQNVVAVYER